MSPIQAIGYLDELIRVIENEDWGEHDFIDAILLAIQELKELL